jgi:hypothetical protein
MEQQAHQLYVLVAFSLVLATIGIGTYLNYKRHKDLYDRFVKYSLLQRNTLKDIVTDVNYNDNILNAFQSEMKNVINKGHIKGASLVVAGNADMKGELRTNNIRLVDTNNKNKWNVTSGNGEFKLAGHADNANRIRIDNGGTMHLQEIGGITKVNNVTLPNNGTKWQHRSGGDAAIVNANDYNTLMIVGREAHGKRRVSVWDELNVNGTLNGSGNTNVNNINVNGKVFFKDPSFSTQPNGTNNSDPYFIEKVVHGGNNSELRLTMNDDANESLQIWSDSCRTTGCFGKGVARHILRADGSTYHAGDLAVDGAIKTKKVCIGARCMTEHDLPAEGNVVNGKFAPPRWDYVIHGRGHHQFIPIYSTTFNAPSDGYMIISLIGHAHTPNPDWAAYYTVLVDGANPVATPRFHDSHTHSNAHMGTSHMYVQRHWFELSTHVHVKVTKGNHTLAPSAAIGNGQWVHINGTALQWTFIPTANGGSQTVDLPLASGWRAYGSGYGTPTVTKMGNLVVVEGLISGNFSNTHLATLPSGMRPGKRLIFSLNNHEGQARVDVLTNGQIHWVAGSKNHSWMSLSGITFRAMN